eukprot:COSAG01_NODE_3777_length_5704_cov_34.622658_1_plen_190_part_00
MGCGGSTAVHQAETKGTVGELVAVVPDGSPHQGTPTPSPAAAAVAHNDDSNKKQEVSTNKEDEYVLPRLFGDKHAMLTYQWDSQEQVQTVRSLLKSRGIPTWMDIDGYAARMCHPFCCEPFCLLLNGPPNHLPAPHVALCRHNCSSVSGPVSATQTACRGMRTDIYDSMAEVSGRALVARWQPAATHGG